ncbi:sortase [Erysipelothrix sp. HDW6C]|nr:sortase [Erysipelothrix sp. HDW6C]
MENIKKKRKLNLLTVVGVIMIVVGLGIVAYDVGTKYFDRRSQQQELQDFMNAPLLNDDGELPTEGVDVNVWGTIQIDKLGVNHLIAKTNDWNYLSRYVVAWESSPNPPAKGNFAIAGHNGNCASCVFRDFDKLEIGDEVKLNDKTSTFVYEITDIFTVDATDVSVLNDTPDEATITLVTCKEQMTNDPNRVIVKGRLVNTIPNT